MQERKQSHKWRENEKSVAVGLEYMLLGGRARPNIQRKVLRIVTRGNQVIGLRSLFCAMPDHNSGLDTFLLVRR